eukprot:TRINITY_DN1745_c0_g1_i1.p1 TRINITY_DN1745_c0_g1~~TRINITY_DN1745_c0_g1_i1.p1  ORF type:complete len:146 (-),score=20.28 TRINITY_DN1745_c0_g1_i1:98-535(-)
MGKYTEMGLCYGAGALFAIGWWIWIDATVWTQNHAGPAVQWWHYVVSLIGIIGLIMVNIVSWSDLDSNNLFGDGVSSRAKIFLFFAFIVAFGGIVAGVWIAAAKYFAVKGDHSPYGGAALIVHCVLTFVSTIMYRFSKAPSEDSF